MNDIAIRFVKTMDVGQYNTINLQAELAAGLREVLSEDHAKETSDSITRSIVAPMIDPGDSDTESLDYPEIADVSEDDLEPETEQMESSEETAFVSSEFHFNLEGITFEADTIQIDCLQYLTTVALKAGGRIMYRQSGDEAYILGSKIGHQYPSHRPIHYIDATDVA